MSKLLSLTAVAIICAFITHAQTNTFPGNVGIGTTSPTNRLHIKGDGSNPAWINFDKSSSSEEAGLVFKRAGNILFYLYNDDATGSEGLKIQASGLNGEGDPAPRLHIPYTNKDLYLVQSGGNVGIGTANPRGVLDVATNGDVYLSNTPNGGSAQSTYLSGHIFLAPYAGSEISYLQARRLDNSGTTSLRLRTFNTASLVDAMHIAGNGNVGIGTVTPQAKLAVNGDIFSRKVKVTLSGWPDYVFEPTYKLPTLHEVEAFIKQNKHLPDVPSEKEVREKGLDLGDNQAVLLRKIEEQMLYIIDQQKQLEQLKAENQELKKLAIEMEQIKSMLNKLVQANSIKEESK